MTPIRSSPRAHRSLVLAATVGVATLVALLAAAGTAHADEHYSGTTVIGPRSGLLVTGQIDDPFEDVLEHAALLGSHTVTND
ncbi:hypothetical protein ACTWP5_11700 [Streptomyces sp. 4N509B]|uniref:hypothetical protein n=1 Tax=Streptomyces sp. 4N509B TaxID=3457413 RepID=UPI003FCF1D2B